MEKYKYFVPLAISPWFVVFNLYQCDILNPSNGRLINKNGIVSHSIWTLNEMNGCVKSKQWKEIDKAEAALII